MEAINFYLDERQENFVAKLSVDEAREHGISIPDETKGYTNLYGSSSSVATFDWVMEGGNLILYISIPKKIMITSVNETKGAAKIANGYLLYSGKIAQ
jgi:hypothetical protein